MADDQAVYLSPEERAALAFVCQAVRSSAIMRDLCRVTWAQVSHRLLQAGVQLHTECGPRALAILKAAMRECAEIMDQAFSEAAAAGEPDAEKPSSQGSSDGSS